MLIFCLRVLVRPYPLFAFSKCFITRWATQLSAPSFIGINRLLSGSRIRYNPYTTTLAVRSSISDSIKTFLTKNFSSIPTQKPGFVFFVSTILGPPVTNFLPAFFDSRMGSYLSTILKLPLSSRINFTLIRNLLSSIASKIFLARSLVISASYISAVSKTLSIYSFHFGLPLSSALYSFINTSIYSEILFSSCHPLCKYSSFAFFATSFSLLAVNNIFIKSLLGTFANQVENVYSAPSTLNISFAI